MVLFEKLTSLLIKIIKSVLIFINLVVQLRFGLSTCPHTVQLQPQHNQVGQQVEVCMGGFNLV